MSDNQFNAVNVKEAAKSAEVWGAFKPHENTKNVPTNSNKQNTKPTKPVRSKVRPNKKENGKSKSMQFTNGIEVSISKAETSRNEHFKKPVPMKRNKKRPGKIQNKKSNSVQYYDDDLFGTFSKAGTSNTDTEKLVKPTPKPRNSLNARSKNKNALKEQLVSDDSKNPIPKPRKLPKPKKRNKHSSKDADESFDLRRRSNSSPKSFLQSKGSQLMKSISRLIPLKSNKRQRCHSESTSRTKNKKSPM